MSNQKLSVSDLISIQNLTTSDISLIFSSAKMLKEKPLNFSGVLNNKTLAS